MKNTLALIFLCGACCFVSQAFAVSANLLHTFNDPTVTDFDQFGLVVAVDGNHVLIGASGDDTNGTGVGQAHLFEIVPEPGLGCLLAGMGLPAAVYRGCGKSDNNRLCAVRSPRLFRLAKNHC